MKHFWKYAVVAGAASLLLITGLGACSKPEEDTSSLLSSAAEDASLFPAGTTMGGRNIGGKTLDEALDISAEITVMEQMLCQEGLSGQNQMGGR